MTDFLADGLACCCLAVLSVCMPACVMHRACPFPGPRASLCSALSPACPAVTRSLFCLSHTCVQVRALAGDARYGKLHELLTIFASQGLEEYAAFHAANGPFVASLGVDHEASTRTMRLLTLCSLAASKSTLSYDAIAAAIQVRAHASARVWASWLGGVLPSHCT